MGEKKQKAICGGRGLGRARNEGTCIAGHVGHMVCVCFVNTYYKGGFGLAHCWPAGDHVARVSTMWPAAAVRGLE